ncbi:MAG: nucleotidyltransferase family protein [Burkholderiaceae bacterium]|nr:nucleotidyltransferase family protein [Burkholderiaceae bacterium]
MEIVGVLLAAGRGTRFDPTGGQDKLMQTLAGGECIAVASARHMLQVLPTVHAVVRPAADQLGAVLTELGCRVEVCLHADTGMAASLVTGLRATRDADAWLIALADMPYVQVNTIEALVRALRGGADIVQPRCGGKGGNPVGFTRRHLAQLLELEGDQGARALLRQHEVTRVEVDDEGIFRDVDTVQDLHK